MTFQPDWISDSANAPESHTELATALGGFARAEAPTLDDAKGLKVHPVEALVALTEWLETRHFGAHLSLLKDAGLPKKARKAAGRAVHRLESKGIDCSVTDQRGGGLGFKVEPLPSYMTVPGGDGLTISLLSDVVHGRLECAFSVYTDEGLQEITLIDMPSRSLLKKIMRDIENDPEAPQTARWAPASPELLRTRISDAVDKTRAADKDLPDGYASVGALLEGPMVEADHPAQTILGEVDPALVARGAELLGDIRKDEQDLVPTPLFTDAWFDELDQTLEAAGEHPDATDTEDRKARVRTALEGVVSTFFVGERRFNEGVRLLDTAYLLTQLDQTEAAQITLATSNALMNTEVSPADIPWCVLSITRLIDVDAFLHHLDHKAGRAHDCHDDHAHDHDHEHGDGHDQADDGESSSSDE